MLKEKTKNNIGHAIENGMKWLGWCKWGGCGIWWLASNSCTEGEGEEEDLKI